MMSEFYVQVKSNACTEEFPDNTSNKFKNRLPNVLMFRELGWKVGLSSITLPVSNKRSAQMTLKNPFLFRFIWFEGWTEESKHGSEQSVNIYNYGHQSVFPNSRSLANIPRSGTELMNEIRNRYLWSIGYQAEIGDFIEYEKSRETILDTRYRIKDKNDYVEFKADDDRFEYHSPPLKYIVMKPVENGECILDNTRTVTDRYGGTFPSVRISLELAIKMKWVEWRQFSAYSERDYLLGPNLRKEFPKFECLNLKTYPKKRLENSTNPIMKKIITRRIKTSCT